MSFYRKGDQVSISGRVQNVEGEFVMIALDHAIDGSAPAMVSSGGISLVRASVHDGDEVEGGFFIHSAIPNSPVVLLQSIDGDASDPASFKTAIRDALVLVRRVEDRKPPSAKAAEPHPVVRPATTPAPAASPVTETPASESTAGKAAPAVHAPAASAPTPAPASTPVATEASLTSDMVKRPEDKNVGERIASVADEALRAREPKSIAELGEVRTVDSPLKTNDDELLLDRPVGSPPQG